jgi:putative phage-type endonuclease
VSIFESVIESMVEQGSMEWRCLRDHRITGSRVGAVLGLSPFQKRKALIKEMVKEAAGEYGSFSNPAMQWGTDMEARACDQYALLHTVEDVVVVGMYHADLPFPVGYSPDRMVGTNGILEVKCPYSLRLQEFPQFKAISELPHYYAQVQLGMLLTGRGWTDFYQWTPNGEHLERVLPDQLWVENFMGQAPLFFEAYTAALEDPSSIEPAQRSDNDWALAAGAYREAKQVAAAADGVLKAAKEELLRLAPEDTEGDGVKVTYSIRAGSVDWKAVAATYKSAAAKAKKFMKADTVVATITIPKGKK